MDTNKIYWGVAALQPNRCPCTPFKAQFSHNTSSHGSVELFLENNLETSPPPKSFSEGRKRPPPANKGPPSSRPRRSPPDSAKKQLAKGGHFCGYSVPKGQNLPWRDLCHPTLQFLFFHFKRWQRIPDESRPQTPQDAHTSCNYHEHEKTQDRSWHIF